MISVVRDLKIKFYAYLNYVVCFITGMARDAMENYSKKKNINSEPGYVPAISDFQDFFVRRFYNRVSDCFSRIVTSNAGAYMDVKVSKLSDDLQQKLEITDKVNHVMNLGSYNYLGFGDPNDLYTPNVLEDIKTFGPSTCSPRVDFGTTTVHVELEKKLAEFLGTEDAICYGMGWATNATTIAVLMGKNDLIILDTLVHNSIVIGSRSSGSTVRVFRHNDMDHLEKIIRKELINGQPRTHRPWGKILVIVEGIYSLDGDIVKLHELVQLKKRYHFSIWIDEAHSIGCMGSTGRGVCEHCNINPKEIDFLMGTFTKSFGAAGGFVAASKKIIDWLRLSSYGNVYADAMPVPVAQQALSVLKVLADHKEGARRIKQLHENAVWFRHELKRRRFTVIGEDGSPIVPIVIPPFSMFTAISRECLEKNLGLVVVSFPAVDILEGRIEICLNAAHSREELQKAIEIIEEACKGLPAKSR
ncbi:aminotransferase, classes I and II family protein [Tritrichomonas foetus]|uniref:serine C-palmitoyltransferase n=1 Tax=Tritrichomonas foetus TaxID=1144522 RepID=A0A1J4KA36_9EUKA|nr:aminotransferase, classes I and II family protein [Tritrichomonas foetus]|eukprot:OHT06556.1 aminotransferase, classes I and II family protein [Tritrichomonas foetus]